MPAQNEWHGEILQLSWSPRAYHLKGFLTEAECEHIKDIVSSSTTASTVSQYCPGMTVSVAQESRCAGRPRQI
jgi:prolyl 4-hydroxylase